MDILSSTLSVEVMFTFGVNETVMVALLLPEVTSVKIF